MKRLLVILAGVLALLVLAERRVDRMQQEERLRGGRLRPLIGMDSDRVGAFDLSVGNRRWSYVRRGGVWRYPAYFDAFVRTERVEMLLKGLLQEACTPVSTEPGDRVRFGLVPGQALLVTLREEGGSGQLAVAIGRGAPAPGSSESYAMLAGNDTIYHLHANPRLALDDPERPMVDPLVLPRELERGGIVEIGFLGAEVERLRRIETAPGMPTMPGMPPQGPTYEWLASSAGEEKNCVSGSAFAYVGFLQRLRYEALHEAAAYVSGDKRRALFLQDDEGRVDTLEVGGADARGDLFLRHSGTGQVLTVTAEKGALLLPTAAALLDSLPEPSPYQRAEPMGGGPF